VCVFCFVVVAPFPSISAGLQSTFIESIDKLSVVRKGEKYRQDKCKKQSAIRVLWERMGGSGKKQANPNAKCK